MRLLRYIALAAAGAFAGARVVRSRRQHPAKALRAAEREAPPAEKGSRRRRLVVHFGLFVAVLAVGGLLVAVSGIVSIKASSGHWAITRWFMSFAMERSVETHTMGHAAFPLDSLDHPALVLRGAGHYETACRPCHGSPDLPHPRIARAMTPHPPYLPPEMKKWEADELFYIVKHGVKFTGMPAWPTQQRDDEVWAMVAFLRVLPDLDAAGYRRLVYGEVGRDPGGTDAAIFGLVEPDGAPPAVVESCARCHGRDGNARGVGAFPKLAGQQPSYLYAALRAYARGARHSGIMEPVAAGLSRDDMRALARYYAAQTPASPDGAPLEAAPLEADVVALGRTIALEGIPARGIPSCADCHGPGAGRRNPFYPNLAGQYADYLVQQLELFKSDHRGGSAYAHLMHPTADRLSKEQMRAVAQFYASLAPGVAGP